MSVKWLPKQTKFKRIHKGIVTAIEFSPTSARLAFGQFGLQVLKHGRLTSTQLEATRRMISKFVRKKETLWIRCIPTTPITAKPAQIRMGKGKGDVSYWVYKLEAGKVLFEVGLMSILKAKRVLLPAAKKLGLPCRIVKRPHLFQLA